MYRSWTWALLSVHAFAYPLDESSMLQMPIVEKTMSTDEDTDDCRCPGYFREQCQAEAAQGCVWTDAGSSNGPWCQCRSRLEPGWEPATPICCEAQTAQCKSCRAGMTVEEYCQNWPWVDGCSEEPEPPDACCRAMTADCLACAAGVSVEQFCEDNPGQHGCPESPPVIIVDPEPPVICCMAMTPDCLACSAGVSVEEYCQTNPMSGCPGFDASACCSASPPASCSNHLMDYLIADGFTNDYREVGTTFTYHPEWNACEESHTGCCWFELDMACVACQAGVLPEDYCASEASSAHPEFCMTGADCCGVDPAPEACGLIDYPIAMGHGFTGDYTEVHSTVEWTGSSCIYNDVVCCYWESLECYACMEQVHPDEFCEDADRRNAHPLLCGPPVGEACCVADPPEWCAEADYPRAIGDGWTTDYTTTGIVYNWAHDTCFEMHTWCCGDTHDLGCVACMNNAHPDEFCAENYVTHHNLCPNEMGAHCCVESPPAECADYNFPIHASSMMTTHFYQEVHSSIHWDGRACNEEHVVCCPFDDSIGCVACQREIHPDHFCDEHALEFQDLCEGHPSLWPDPSECCSATPVDGCEHVEFPLALGHGSTTDYTQVGTTYTWSGSSCSEIFIGCCWDEWDAGCAACERGVAPADLCTLHGPEYPQFCLSGEECCVAQSAQPAGCDQVLYMHAMGIGFTTDHTAVGVTFEWSGGTCTEVATACCHDNSQACSACREGVAPDDLCNDHADAYPEFCIPVDQAPAAVCPEGWEQRGEIGADIGGCGLQSCDQRYDITSEAACAARCDEHDDCRGFSYAPMNGDRNHPGVTACTIYNSDMPNQIWTGTQGIATQVFCGREAGNVAAAGPVVHVLIDNSDSNTKCVTAPVAVICADDAGHYGNRINSHTAGDTFDITVGGDDRNEVCATRTDSSGGWGMHLEISCVSAPVHILIDNSDQQRKCVTHSFPVMCAGDAGHLGNRINSHQAGDTFDIETSGNEVCATRTDAEHGWGMHLMIACVAATQDDIDGQIVSGTPVNVLIDNSDTNVKCVDAPYPVICASDAGHIGNRVNTHSADDQFEITTDGREVCARRLDGDAGWGMHLEITCVSRPANVFIGNSDSNTKCVTANQPVICADDAGHLGVRVNQHSASDTFEITSAGSSVCARRTDADHGWGMQLEIVCIEQPGCTQTLLGGGIHTSGVPDGASAIQFIDLGAGAMPADGSMVSVSYRLGRANQAGMKFQVYRPAGGNNYDLIMESEALDTSGSGEKTIQLATPLFYQAGDYIGWVHTGQGTFNFHQSGGNVRWRYGIQGVGSRIDFNGGGSRVYSYEAVMDMC